MFDTVTGTVTGTTTGARAAQSAIQAATGAATGAANGDFARLLDQGAENGTAAARPVSGSSTAGRIAGGVQLLSQPLLATPEEIAQLGRDNTDRLRTAGIATDGDIKLECGADGHVRAKDGTPDKDRIDALFAADPELENQYRKVQSTLELNAMARVSASYVADYQAAKDDDERASVWSRYHSLMNQVSAAGATMTLSGGALTSGAQTFVAGLKLGLG
jgi:hypothetical protein